MIKTVIFDMDGVIVDTEPVHQYAYMQHFKELNIQVSDQMYASFIGNSTKNVYEKIKANFSVTQDLKTLVNRKRELFNNAFDTKENIELLDGVENLIKDLYHNGIQLILASSSAKVTIYRIFRRFNLFPYFTHLISGEDFPESKPNPAIFLHAASLAIGSKENCIVIEDSTNGIKASRTAGIFCIGYNRAYSQLQDLSQANLIIHHFNELTFNKIQHIK